MASKSDAENLGCDGGSDGCDGTKSQSSAYRRFKIKHKFQQMVLRTQAMSGLTNDRVKSTEIRQDKTARLKRQVTKGSLFKRQPAVTFDDFRIIRIIGRGSFSKVCLVRHLSSRQLMAMKCMCKATCISMGAVKNITHEVNILRQIDHPFIVRLLYTFQDDEDLFLVLESLMGGDLRYHLNNHDPILASLYGGSYMMGTGPPTGALAGSGPFNEEHVRFIIAEIGCALNYIHARGIIHRDVKPDNIMLDEKGHARLTDFNVATTTAHYPSRRVSGGEDSPPQLIFPKPDDYIAIINESMIELDDLSETKNDSKDNANTGQKNGSEVKEKRKRFSIAGTAPYMAPEIFACALSKSPDYGSAIDWWSLGVTAYELIYGLRPYPIESSMRWIDVTKMFESHVVHYPAHWSPEFTDLIQSIMDKDPDKRVSNLTKMKRQKLMANINLVTLSRKRLDPPFVPDTSVINCDPTLELEEVLLEVKPLYKKKKKRAQHDESKMDSSETASESGSDSSPSSRVVTILKTQEPPSASSKTAGIVKRHVDPDLTAVATTSAHDQGRRRMAAASCDLFASFPVYNREWQLYQEKLNSRETEWESQLADLMANAAVAEVPTTQAESTELSTQTESSSAVANPLISMPE